MHERWIIDFKIDLRLGSNLYLHLHTVRDPVGAAFIAAVLHPAEGPRSKVHEAQVRQTLRLAFAAGGFPEEVQTDGEGALNSQPGDNFPSPFTLWLIALGIRHLRSRPGVPTDDAEVERAHRTLYDYCLIDALAQPLSLPELRARLQQAVEVLNYHYPSRAHGCHGRPPFTAHPELQQPPRPFDPHFELARFDLQRVDAYLAPLCFERKVGKMGQITLGGKAGRYTVGRDYVGQVVSVHFDPADRCFVAAPPDQTGHEIRRWPAKLLSTDDILGFSLETPPPCPQQLPLPLPFQQPMVKEPALA